MEGREESTVQYFDPARVVDLVNCSTRKPLLEGNIGFTCFKTVLGCIV